MSLALPVSDDAPVQAASATETRLERARAAVESRFLQAGEVLGASADGVGELLSALERLAQAVGGETIEATTAEMHRAAEALTALPARHEARQARLRELARWGAALRRSIEDMRRDLAYLGVFAINIKVAAAPLSGAGEDFAVFAQELADRIQAGREELEGFAAELRALEPLLAGAHAQEQALAAQCSRMIPALPDGLRSGAEEMAAHHARVAAVAAETTGLAREIQRKMGAALAALQVGDSTRQRIEHVQLGLAAPAASDIPRDRRDRISAVVARLLRAQLDAAAAEFARDSAELSASMEGIAADAADVLRLGDVALGRTAAGEAFFDRLRQHLAGAVDLVRDMEAADRGAGETGRAAAASAAALGDRIAALQAIRRDVQHMALNAAIKCARVGELGRPLAVIAVELRAHAELLEASANRALETLDTLGAESERLAHEDAGSNVGQVLAGAAERLQAASAAAEQELSAVSAQGHAVVGGLREAVRQLDFQREIGSAMRDAAAALARTAAQPGGLLDTESAAAMFERIAKAYTMAQERQVHAQVLAELGLAPVSGAAPAPAAALEDALF